MSRIPKLVLSADEGQEKLKAGIRTLAMAVKSTMGPDGKTVVIEGDQFISGREVTKDGVTVANSVTLLDPVENQGAEMLKDAAKSTYTIAGDGTTTSIVLAESLIDNFERIYSDEVTVSKIDLIRATKTITEKMANAVDKFAINISSLSDEQKRDKLFNIASISANNDYEIGKLVSDLFMKTDNVVLENSNIQSTYDDFIEGIVLDKGYVNSQFINNQNNNTCEFNNPFMLFCDVEIHDLSSLEPVIRYAHLNGGRPLVLVGKVKQNVLNALIMNNNNPQSALFKKLAVITPPSFGERSREIMKDLADVLGGVYYSDYTGDNMQHIDEHGLAEAKRIVIRDSRTIVYPTEEQVSAIDEKVSELKSYKSKDVNNDRIDERIKTLSSSVGIIYVGSPSHSETTVLKASIDDAVRAVYASIEAGVVPGGGKTLINVFQDVYNEIQDKMTDAEELALEILEKVAMTPLRQMLINSGFEERQIESIIKNVSNSSQSQGYNIKKRDYADLIADGVLDPSMVLKSALNNSISVASTILTVGCVITNYTEFNLPQ